jgi:HD-GYP domain-containing protein (c-di-GMP phosphodiesterase class II)
MVTGVDDGSPTRSDIRLAEIVAALSLGIDLGFGQPMEHVLRQCLISLHLAEQLELADEEKVVVYYTALLLTVGCHSDAHEQAKWFGDDFALKANKYKYGLRDPRGTAATMGLLGGRGNPPLHRFRVGLEFAISGRSDLDEMFTHHAALARMLAEQLGLGDDVQAAVAASYEQWDGKGWPGELRGDAVPIGARIAGLAEFVEVAHRVGGVPAAIKLARKRSGKQFDPAVAAALCAAPEDIFADLDTTQTWKAVIAAEPALGVRLSDGQLESALTAIANFIDLKSPYFLGHGQAVADLANEAGRTLGITGHELSTLHRAGLVHGFGRLGVSNSILDKPGPLGGGEWERIRFQPYVTERMLQQSDVLAPLGVIAVQHRERLDGSGYPRSLSGNAISVPARVLGAADAYQSMCEPRPQRAALSAEQAAGQLRSEVKTGRFDGDAAEAVLSAAGHRAVRRREGPAGLTAREVDVLRLVARGLSSKDIASRLVISPKTARNHIEHIYTKIGATSRVTASLFAMDNGLLPAEGTNAVTD